jgi:hypothetical protein
VEEQEVIEVRRRRPVARLIALALLLLIAAAALILWSQRRPIAEDYIDRELAKRGVRATYEVKRIGIGTQRLEKLVVGDPANPDLTARWVEVKLRWGWFFKPHVELITARGVRLNGRLVGGKVRFGEVDKLLPPPTGKPFRFPDQAIDVADASIRLETPAGRIGLAVAGRGNLADGFKGEMAGVSDGLTLGTCRLAAPRAYWTVRIDVLRPTIAGPLNAASLACGDDLAIARPRVDLRAVLTEGLNGWRGRAGVAVADARIGRNALRNAGGSVTFDGNLKETKGAVDVAAAALSVPGVTAGRTRIDGDYALSLKTGDASLDAAMTAAGVSASAPVAGIANALASAGGTPVEPVGDALAAAVRRAAAAFDAAGTVRVDRRRNGGAVRFSSLTASSRSGVRLALGGGDGVSYSWPGGLSRIDGEVRIDGGGLPATRLSLSQPRAGGPIGGVARMQPVRAGNARLALSDIRFSAAPGGTTSIDTVATIDGPIPDGRVEGLVLPVSARIDGRGGLRVGERCVTARFRSLGVGSLRLGPSTLPLCPTGPAMVWRNGRGGVQGGAQVRGPRLAGRIGQTPITIAGSGLRVGFDGPIFTGSDVAVRLGTGESVTRLDFASLSGRFARRAIEGRYAGFAGRIGNVPLSMSEGSGGWSLVSGVLKMQGAMTVADTAEAPRFHPLAANDFSLVLANNRIEAGGWLHDPETGTRITNVSVTHDLRAGRGSAVLDVPGITFGPDYQPEQLTRLTTGVIALVNGTLQGRGEIQWDGKGATSSGSFWTDDMDFAAAFGPVEGLKTRVEFSDLLGLATAPGQLAEIGLIRTGIDVLDGSLRYQLLPGLRVKVEGGRWPFAGGELLLEETVLDFSKPSAKTLTFRIVGLDAARFVQQMEFSNITATGTFDGVIPMVFDEGGGRIVGGSLVAREEGGTISYIGELSDKDLGAYGKLAFDALKSLRYSKLTIALDGQLDGEFVAGIELDGIARDPALGAVGTGGGFTGALARRAFGQLAKIPFEFNITIKGPFRTLLATARSLEDPTNLIQSVLPEKLRAPEPVPPAEPEQTPETGDRPPTPPVQPQESETMR